MCICMCELDKVLSANKKFPFSTKKSSHQILAELSLQVLYGVYQQQQQKIMKRGPYLFSAFQWHVTKIATFTVVSTCQP